MKSKSENKHQKDIELVENFATPEGWRKYKYYDLITFSLPDYIVRTKHGVMEQELDETDESEYTCIRGMHLTKEELFANKGDWEGEERMSPLFFPFKIMSVGYSYDEEGNLQDENDYCYAYSNEVLPLKETTINTIVKKLLVRNKLVGEPRVKWINVDGAAAMEIRCDCMTMTNEQASCIFYYMFNYSVRVVMAISYKAGSHDKHKELDNIIKTFKWLSPLRKENEKGELFAKNVFASSSVFPWFDY